jgi:protein-S-isoprenylcysteine O-methyltransferase Ste14
MMLGQLAGLIGLTAAVLQARGLAFVGVQQALDYAADKQDFTKAGLGEELVINGLYSYMRHPLYTFSMMLLWLTPTFSRNYLIFVLLSTAYFVIGSIFEEQRLENDFGEAYKQYKMRVPRFVPWKIQNS